ncbi:SNARE associated Golgi protein [Musa troglodytarum]|uniref:SNARE associated Golgi protein n=1 Tax=Musa troglodytarum TaxID=320322 RepID=A0A9E7JAQ0_9LILI|nr:SNARE associated Golgi protein [Musa troglodytarum]
MASGEAAAAHRSPEELETLISELQKKHQMDLLNLTLTTQPFKTLQFFIFATLQYLRRSLVYILAKGGWILVLFLPVFAVGLLLLSVDGPHEKHIQELIHYTRFSLWWVALGVASSIGLGSGLHTFVLYLGPHIAFFTIKAMKCGRVDLKAAPYDTIQLKMSPSWLEKDCSEFGPPVYPALPGSLVRVPLSSILPQVQLEAILWGLGTALGELPPYFIARAARMSGNKVGAVEELDAASSKEDGFLSFYLKKTKRWFLSHSQHLNFFTILVLASVPNPLFDLAGIMCGQFGISFWKFFLATLTGKAIIKAHIQDQDVFYYLNHLITNPAES